MGRWLSVSGYKAKSSEHLKHEAIVEKCIETNEELPEETVKYLEWKTYERSETLVDDPEDDEGFYDSLRSDLREKLYIRIQHNYPEEVEEDFDYPITEVLIKDIPEDCVRIQITYN